MNFKYQPLGIAISSSFAISSSLAQSTNDSPATASLVSHSFSPVGPTGSQFKTLIGTTLPTSSI